MYTLVLLFSFVQIDTGATLSHDQIPGFDSAVVCDTAAKKAASDLEHTPVSPNKWKVTVKASCLKIK